MRPWMKWILAATVLVLGLTLACQGWRRMSLPGVKEEIRQRFPDVPQMSVAELRQILDDGRRSEGRGLPLLLDVRRGEEFEVSHLPGAVHFPPGSAAMGLESLASKDTPIVVYCSVGYRSSRMARQLRAAGYSNVSNLEGSIFEWANGGHPVERDGRRVEQVHPYNRLWGRLLDGDLHPENVHQSSGDPPSASSTPAPPPGGSGA